MKAFKSVFVAHYKQFVRDRTAMFFTFIFPVMFILVFGWAFSDPGTTTFDIGIVDEGSSQSTNIITQSLNTIEIDHEQVFEIITGERQQMLDDLRKGDLDAVIVVLSQTDSAIATGQSINVPVYYDPSQTVNQQIMIPILKQVIDQIDRTIQATPQLIAIEENSVQAHDLRYIDYLVPGILGMSLMFTGIYGGMPIIQQRQAHIIKRLGCTPLRRSMLIFGELVFRMIIVILTAAIIILFARLAFDVQMVGNWAELSGIVILGTLVFSVMGYLVAAFVKTEEGAIPVINIITFPMMFLSGTFFEITNMPAFIDPVVKILPLTYLGDALRQIMVDGTPLHAMSTDVIVMAGWTIIPLAITIRYFRWD